MSSPTPSVTLGLLAYNSCPYIGDAVRGALDQIYSPLQVILSDDASTDESFGVMEKTAREYRGPHQVLLNRNPQNLGIGGHVNRIADLATGEWLVLAAGDDVSLPHRVSELMRHVKDSTFSIYSNLSRISADGSPLGPFVTDGNNNATNIDQAVAMKGVHLIGASHACRMEQFRIFGSLDSRLHREDEALGFRSLLLGEIEYIDQQLVLYREHGANICVARRDHRIPLSRQRLIEVERETAKVNTWISALATMINISPEADQPRLRKAMMELERYKSEELDLRLQLLSDPMRAIARMFGARNRRIGMRTLFRNLLYARTTPEHHRQILNALGKLKKQLRGH